MCVLYGVNVLNVTTFSIFQEEVVNFRLETILKNKDVASCEEIQIAIHHMKNHKTAGEPETLWENG